MGFALIVAMAGPASAAQAKVGLGTAGSFDVLGGSAVTNTGPTTTSANVGVSPGSAITGFPPGVVSAPGAKHAADALAASAQAAVTTAYNDAAGRSSTLAITADLGGRTLISGVYTGSTSLALTGPLTLDGQGDPDAVFIFKAGSTLTTASGSSVVLIGQAQACNVFWQVGSSATLGTSTQFVGTILAQASITATTSASIDGRLFARTGAVTLDSNTFFHTPCIAAPPATTTTVGGSTTTTVGGSTTTAVGGGPTGTTVAPTLAATGSPTSLMGFVALLFILAGGVVVFTMRRAPQ